MGGFLFDSMSKIRRLCIDAYGLTEARVDDLGPLDSAFLYFQKHQAIDSPSFIPVTYYHRSSPNVPRKGHALVCRLAFVSLYMPKPDLSRREDATVRRQVVPS